MKDFTITLCVCFPNKKAFDFPCETYSEDVAFCVGKGEFAYRLGEEERHTVRSGQVVFCPSGTAFHREMKQPTTFCMLKFRPASPGVYPPTPISVKDTSRFYEDLEHLKRSVICSDMEKFPEAAHFSRDLLYLAEESKDLPPSPVAKEHAYLTGHLSEEISVRSLADSAGYTVARFIQLFRAHYGKTPKDFLLALRLEKAQKLLWSTSLSVGEIALSVGYSDPLYFSRLFHRRLGLSPTAFRRLIRL